MAPGRDHPATENLGHEARAVPRRDRQAEEIAIADRFPRQRTLSEQSRFDEVAGKLLSEWPPELRDPFFCGDDPLLDFELQGRLNDGF